MAVSTLFDVMQDPRTGETPPMCERCNSKEFKFIRIDLYKGRERILEDSISYWMCDECYEDLCKLYPRMMDEFMKQGGDDEE